jgi:hypothetical protein
LAISIKFTGIFGLFPGLNPTGPSFWHSLTVGTASGGHSRESALTQPVEITKSAAIAEA